MARALFWWKKQEPTDIIYFGKMLFKRGDVLE